MNGLKIQQKFPNLEALPHGNAIVRLLKLIAQNAVVSTVRISLHKEANESCNYI